jgi:hypothetical protein
MIHIVDLYFHDTSSGHYSVQRKWLLKLMGSRSFCIVEINLIKLFKFIFTTDKTDRFLFSNFSLYDRNSIFETILALLIPKRDKIIICHSVSKIKILNHIFCYFLRNSQLCVYSLAMKEYLGEFLNANRSVDIVLCEFPNAEYVTNKIDVLYQKEYLNKKVRGICWGNAQSRMDVNKISILMEMFVDNLLILSNKPEMFTNLCNKFPGRVAVKKIGDETSLANDISNSDFNIMAFDNDFDFYKSKLAASGVYLTCLKFGIPTIAWYRVGMHKKEILLDTSSMVVKNELDLLPLQERVLRGEKKVALDNLIRKRITLW